MKKNIFRLVLAASIFIPSSATLFSVSVKAEEWKAVEWRRELFRKSQTGGKLPSDTEEKKLTYNPREMKKIRANPEGFSTSDGKIYTDEEVKEREGSFRIEQEKQRKSSSPNDQKRPLRSIFGEDDRKRITDTNQSPYQSIVLLQSSALFTELTCSGAIIDDSTILTAAHCLYDHSSDRYMANMTVSAGYTNGKEPYGTVKAIRLIVPNRYMALSKSMAESPNNWMTDDMIRVDYGLVKVPKGTFKNHTFFKLSCNSRQGDSITITGYPSDKEEGFFSFLGFGNPTMWESRGTIISNLSVGEHSILKHKIDTYAGMSGAPNYHSLDGENFYIYGIFSSGGRVANYSCGLTESTIASINAMKQ